MQAHEVDAGTGESSAWLATSRLIVGGPGRAHARDLSHAGGPSRAGDLTAACDEPIQLIPCKQIPQTQSSQRNGLRPVRIEAEQPGPDQAI